MAVSVVRVERGEAEAARDAVAEAVDAKAARADWVVDVRDSASWVDVVAVWACSCKRLQLRCRGDTPDEPAHYRFFLSVLVL